MTKLGAEKIGSAELLKSETDLIVGLQPVMRVVKCRNVSLIPTLIGLAPGALIFNRPQSEGLSYDELQAGYDELNDLVKVLQAQGWDLPEIVYGAGNEPNHTDHNVNGTWWGNEFYRFLMSYEINPAISICSPGRQPYHNEAEFLAGILDADQRAKSAGRPGCTYYGGHAY